MLNILLLNPCETPREEEIHEGWEAMEEIVGGPIGFIFPFAEPVAVIYNNDCMEMGLPMNRIIRYDRSDNNDLLAGTLIICGASKDGPVSLSPALLEKYKNIFKRPEMILIWGNEITSIPIPEPIKPE